MQEMLQRFEDENADEPVDVDGNGGTESLEARLADLDLDNPGEAPAVHARASVRVSIRARARARARACHV